MDEGVKKPFLKQMLLIYENKVFSVNTRLYLFHNQPLSCEIYQTLINYGSNYKCPLNIVPVTIHFFGSLETLLRGF